MQSAALQRVVMLAVVPLVLLVVLSQGGRKAQLQEATAVIRPEVVEALTQESEVKVLISLKQPEVPLSLITNELMRQNASERQDRVLGALAPSDFTLLRKYEVAAALFGRITKSGVDDLASQEDVLGVGVNFNVFGGLAESGLLISNLE